VESTPNESIFPSWMEDDATDSCVGCSKKFTLINRKHHCRRCRNLFCEICTSHTAPILLFSIKEEVRVCDSCFLDIRLENRYFHEQKPILQAGTIFKQSACCSSKMVSLRLLPDGVTLVCNDERSGKSNAIAIANVEPVKVCSSTTFSIVSSSNGNSREFIADSGQTQTQWVAALNAAIERAHQPTLKEIVEESRRKILETRNRSEYEQRRHEELQQKRDSRKSEAEKMKNKWSS